MFVWGESVRSDLARVAYRLKEGALLRITWPTLDRGPVSEPVEALILSNVEEFKVKFVGTSGGSSDEWPVLGVANEEIPRAVEVTIKIKDRAEFTRKFFTHG
jgi:general secretion pathway protein J